MNNRYNKIYISLPSINELEYIPYTIKAVSCQTFRNFELFVCVNQPEACWEKKTDICINNQKTIDYLRTIKDFPVTVIDKCSKGKGWEDEKTGVGWARKTIMDAINEKADINDIIISIDADTTFSPDYFQSVIDNFNNNHEATALAVPYYHKLTGDDSANGAMLRYEIYMRNYNINMWRIKSPYSFTALGSAIALPVWAYRGIGGITPKKSGEDFYFLQKLCKYGNILKWNKEKVYPGTRFSDRVFFGTGPAMIKGSKGDWESYPIYHYSLFDNIKETYCLFPALFEKDITLPVSEFLEQAFKTSDIWAPLRKNSKNADNFTKACHEKFDGLRILQYLKGAQKNIHKSDEECLIENMNELFGKDKIQNFDIENLSFADCSIEKLNHIRDFLAEKEEEYQRN